MTTKDVALRTWTRLTMTFEHLVVYRGLGDVPPNEPGDVAARHIAQRKHMTSQIVDS